MDAEMAMGDGARKARRDAAYSVQYSGAEMKGR
jgi:hypothetical protein